MSRVFVLGNAGVDLSLALPHLPRPGETVVATAARRAPGGKGLNQAVTAARAGATVTFWTPVGEDGEAAYLAAALAGEKLAALHLVPKPHPTDRSIVMVAADGENSIASIGFCADAATEAEAATFAARVGPSDWLLIQGNFGAAATHSAMRASAGKVMFNAAPLRWPVAPMLPSCALLVVNRVEAEAISGFAEPQDAAAWLHAQGCATALVTLGSDGCLWADATGLSRRPAPPATVVDTTGAGDVFCGVLLAGLTAGITVAQAIPAAQAAASLSVTRYGAFDAIPTAAELSRS